jgi:hypothetical protein
MTPPKAGTQRNRQAVVRAGPFRVPWVTERVVAAARQGRLARRHTEVPEAPFVPWCLCGYNSLLLQILTTKTLSASFHKFANVFSDESAHREARLKPAADDKRRDPDTTA